MSYSKIASIALYCILGITIPILVLFYFGDSLVNQEKYQSKVQKIENPTYKSFGLKIESDLQSADSLANTSNPSKSINEGNASNNLKSGLTNEIRFTFIENLVYHKLDIALIWGYILLFIAILTALVFPVVYMIAHPVNLLRTILILVGISVLLGISYLLSSSEPMQIIGYSGTNDSDPGILKLIDTGLILSYFVLGLAVIAIVYSEISNYFK
jgi:hypothetical protein